MNKLILRSPALRCSFLFALVAVTLSGCVTAGKYHDLEDQNNKTNATLAQCDSERAELQKKLGISSTEKTQLEGSVSDMKKALADAEARKLETEKRLAEFRELTDRFKELVNAGKLTIKFQNGRMLIALSTDILFSSGSAQLSAAGKDSITEVTGVLKDMSNRNFQIEGHTDNVPIHTKQFPSNWELASARAGSVLNTMLAAGFPPEHVSTASYGSEEPVADNADPKGRSENRRIAIAIVPDLSSLPGFDELNRMSGSDKAAAAMKVDSEKVDAASGTKSDNPTSSPAASSKAASGGKPVSMNDANKDIQKNAPKDVHSSEVPALPDNATKNVDVSSSGASN
jgi:chemotaxis protein MotB